MIAERVMRRIREMVRDAGQDTHAAVELFVGVEGKDDGILRAALCDDLRRERDQLDKLIVILGRPRE